MWAKNSKIVQIFYYINLILLEIYFFYLNLKSQCVSLEQSLLKLLVTKLQLKQALFTIFFNVGTHSPTWMSAFLTYLNLLSRLHNYCVPLGNILVFLVDKYFDKQAIRWWDFGCQIGKPKIYILPPT